MRINWIDWLKVIGIFFVLWGHCESTPEIKKYIYSFHMPLFFLIAGYLSSDRHITSGCKKFILKHFRSLIIPYFVLGSVAFLVWSVKVSIFPYDIAPPIWRPLVGMFYGSAATASWMEHCIASWFLPCLFCTHILHYFLKTRTKNLSQYILSCGVCVVVGLLLWNFSPIRLPFGFETALIAIIFYGVGHIFRSLPSLKITFNKLNMLFVIILLTVIHISACFYFGGSGDMRGGNFNNPAGYFVAAFAGIAFWRLIAHFLPNLAFSRFISRNTLVMFVWQGSFKAAFDFVLFAVFGMKNNDALESIWGGLVYAISAFIVLALISECLRKICPWAIGESGKTI